MKRYAYHRPGSLEEAWRLHGESSAPSFIAGGTDLVVQLRRDGAFRPDSLISLRAIPDLGSIEAGEAFRIGAGVTVGEIGRDPAIREAFPALARAALSLGSRQIRSVATLGGNICKASPAADLAGPLLVHEARVEIRGPETTREVPLEEFFLGPGETLLGSGEILVAVILDRPPEGAGSVFLRRGRTAVDCATASLSAYAEGRGGSLGGVRLAAGAVAPTPLRLGGVEALVEGKEVSEDLLAEAAKRAMEEVSPIGDIRSSADYRRHLMGVFTRRALRELGGG